MFQSLLILSALPASIFALEWQGPDPTPVLSNADSVLGFSPKPTDGPQLPAAVALRNLDKRRLLGRQKEPLYPDTCGYVDGNGAYPYSCQPGYICGFNSRESVFGCCRARTSRGSTTIISGCYVDDPYTCYDSSDADLCTGVCTESNVRCDFAAPNCRTIVQFGTTRSDSVQYTGYDCVEDWFSSSVELDYAYATVFTPEQNPQVRSDYTCDNNRETCTPIGGQISTLATTSTSDPEPVGSDKNGTGKPKSKAGAIAGGVVGGLAGIGIIVGLVIWFLTKKKSKARQQTSAVQEVSHTTWTHEGK